MGAYAYVAPKTVEEALAVLKEHAEAGKRAQPLAGGTDLLVQMRGIDREPRTIVDIKKIAETNRLDIGEDEIYIGSAIPCAELYENERLKGILPGLLEASDLIGSTQIQGRATMGGNLCNASPAGDSIPAMIVDRGVCVIAAANGQHEMAVEEFCTGVGENALVSGEFLLGLKFPRPAANTSDAYLRFIPRTEMDIAVAGCGVSVTLDGAGICTAARVAIGAVAPTPLLVPAAGEALIGTALDAAALGAAGEACTEASSPITDKRGTADYRRKVIAVLCRRAGAIARDRARGEQSQGDGS
ncbi:MAG: xanthine dehydrogenase family protein subunit M [Pseudomonadales bacterium]|jgi:carbon-monoxide dehydrogenase medium subunit|nr:xanthine dehydrogenase family protein subunit M [Pseudomonadales bacterium]MDP6472934.1 xanthine dehydrogenase family protein subunit M [Pseudomonadales bacterium]MDP6826309.1 xanthine dehydrogenase family protein subunit M [Pseudomonadales bacterium]MDP6972774.1 xanthine dehydrogenase family protein subunit M [Pseudomonadales bacterium]